MCSFDISFLQEYIAILSNKNLNHQIAWWSLNAFEKNQRRGEKFKAIFNQII